MQYERYNTEENITKNNPSNEPNPNPKLKPNSDHFSSNVFSPVIKIFFSFGRIQHKTYNTHNTC